MAKKNAKTEQPAAANAADAAPASTSAAATEKQKAVDMYNTFKYPTIIFGTVLALYLALKKGEWTWFSWHPFLMVTSCITLGMNAIMVKKIGGLENTRLHANLFGTSAILMIGGFYVIYTNKDMQNKEHFTTTHGQIGSIIATAMVGIMAFGSVALHPDWGMFRSNELYRSLHKLFGRLCIVWAWSACLTGLMTIEENAAVHVAVVLPLLYAANALLK